MKRKKLGKHHTQKTGKAFLKKNPKLVCEIVLCIGSPSMSWNLRLHDGRGTEPKYLCSGSVVFDDKVVELIERFEAVGIEVVGSRYRVGEGGWMGPKEIRWFKRIQQAFEHAEEESEKRK